MLLYFYFLTTSHLPVSAKYAGMLIQMSLVWKELGHNTKKTIWAFGLMMMPNETGDLLNLMAVYLLVI